MNLELYINNRLCDIESPEKLGITLKRVFINPSELSVKDAQKSYDISLPATAVNNEIFNHVNVEEVQGKFKIYGDARLYVNGILILDGKFRLSEITKDYYRGNLGVPAPITVKDIFGETMMNQAGKWMIPFSGVESITEYNKMENPECIFPLVLYGLLPKESFTGSYSAKDVYDDSVRFSMEHIPPSVNCVAMLKKLFENAGYTLSGTAIHDERLKNLYMSYKNSKEYVMPWNTGNMTFVGAWQNYSDSVTNKEKHYTTNDTELTTTIATNLFNSTNLYDHRIDSGGTNVIFKNEYGTKNVLFKVPHDGLYKIKFGAQVNLRDPIYGIEIPGVEYTTFSDLDKGKTELKLVRYKDTSDFEKESFDNTFYKNNQDQTLGDNKEGFIFPQSGAVNFIDPKQNSNFLCGFSWGRVVSDPQYTNPLYTNGGHNPMAISGGHSWSVWDKDNGTDARFFSAVNSPVYKKRQGNRYVDANQFEVKLENAIATTAIEEDDTEATGYIYQVVWLNKGELLNVVSVSEYNDEKWCYQHVYFNLKVEEFKPYKNWLKLDNDGGSTESMNFNDPSSYPANKLDIIRFLPEKIKVNDWIDNFCKAFNLSTVDKGNKNIEINVRKHEIVTDTSRIIDLDNRANVHLRQNESLKLPAAYELGFTIDQNEEGYYYSITEYKVDENGIKTDEKLINTGDRGGGRIDTGSLETGEVNQTSTFSYCWYKLLNTLDENGNKIPLIEVPVITDKEAWESNYDYTEMRENSYYDKNLRFWYKTGLIDAKMADGTDVMLSTVSNEYKGEKTLKLNYEDKPESIMRNYFLLLINNDNNYTIVSCHLRPEEYSELHQSLVKLNGDLYHIAEADGYDPLGSKQTKLKLIRKIL